MSSRPDLGAIRVQNQVRDDEMIDYRPNIGGMVNVPFFPPIEMTRTEGKLID